MKCYLAELTACHRARMDAPRGDKGMKELDFVSTDDFAHTRRKKFAPGFVPNHQPSGKHLITS